MNINTASTDRRNFLRAGMVGGALVGSGALATFLAGCSAKDSGSAKTSKVTAADVRAAKGQVDVLTFAFYQPKELNAGAVKAHYSTVSSADEILAKIRSRSTPLGVVNTGSNLMRQIYATDRFAPVSTEALSHFDDLEVTLRENPAFSHNGEIYAIPFAVSPGLTAWDARKVPEPTSADGLLGVDYRNQISLFDDAEILQMMHYALGGNMATFSRDDLDAVLKYMDELRPNIKTFHTFGQEVDLLGRGDIGVALPTYGSLLTAAREANPAVKGNAFASVSFVDCWSVAADASQAKALSWIDQSLSAEGQRSLQAASGGYPSVGGDVDFSKLPTELDNVSLKDWLKQSAVAVGVPVEADGDLVNLQTLQQAWSQYKAKF